MEFQISAYAVTDGAYSSSVSLGSFGVNLAIGSPIAVVITSDANALDHTDPTQASIRVGDDDLGPVQTVEFREFSREVDGETVTYSLVRMAVESSADVYLLAIDPATGRILSEALPEADDYRAGTLFDAIIVAPLVNTAPVAGPDQVTLNEDGSISIDVLANDTDADGDTLVIESVGDAGFGETEVIAGMILYTPNANANGSDSFTYVLSDGTTTVTGTVSASVTAVNDAPGAVNDVAGMDEDTFIFIDVLGNDVDVDGDALTITRVGDVSLGSLSIEGGQIRFAPDEDAFGEFTFSYDVSDGTDTETATVTVTVADVADTFTGTDGSDQFTATAGVETFVLDGGADQVTGDVENFFGDTITGFDDDDVVVFLDEVDRDQLVVTDGSAIVAVDSDGDGGAEGSFTLTGNFSSGDFMAVVGESQTRFTFADFLPSLADRQAVDAELVNGIVNEAFLTGTGTQDLRVTLKDLGFAANDNVLGAYEITETGEIVDTVILFENANADKTASTVLSGVEAGHKIGFFLVQDAAEWLQEQDDADVFSFVNDSGAAATVSDSAILLAVNGVAAEQVTFHSFDAALNPDGIEHALSGVDVGGESITVGFEDKLGGGDRDYEDVAFSVEFIDLAIV
ncbi:MAG: Ig-like domain-containing protein [Pseudomonadota bacterium]